MPLGLSTSGIKVTALEKVCSIKKSKNTETGFVLKLPTFYLTCSFSANYYRSGI